MTRNIRRFWAWESTRVQFYFNTAPAGLTTGSGRCRALLNGLSSSTNQPRNDPGLIAFSYVAVADTVITAFAGANGTKCQIAEVGSYGLWVVKASATTYTLELRRASDEFILGSGATAFTFGTQYDWVIGRDTNDVRWYWNDMTAAEITGAESGSVDSLRVKTTNVDAGAYVEFGPGLITETSEFGVDRPDPTTIQAGAFLVTSGTPQFDDHTHDESGTPKTNAWESVDDISNPDDDSTFVENPSTADSGPWRQSFVTSSPTISNPKAVRSYERKRATVSSKTMDVKAIFCDGTNSLEVGLQVVTLNTYGDFSCITELAPDLGAWSQAKLDSLQLGWSWEIGPDPVTLRTTSLFGEAIGFDYNPEPAVSASLVVPNRPMKQLLRR